MDKRKLNIEFIRAEFAKEGYILLTKVYKNNRQKLEYICSKGHRHSISWGSWKKGKRCPYCYGNAKLNIKFIRAEFKKEGYTLLTIVYKNNTQKLDYICPVGHRHFITWGCWKQNQRCPYCHGNAKLNIEFVRAEFEKEGYILLTKIYEGSRQKLDYVCPEGHKHSISYHHWQCGDRCFYCAGNVKLKIEFIRAEFAKEGYTLLTTIYDNAHQKLEYVCPKRHRHNIDWNHWQQGQRCPVCPSKVSKWELEVKKYVKSLNVAFLSNSRNILINPNTSCNLELDLWFPDLNKAIECNGIYWHSTKKASERDKVKFALCEQKNINLLILNDVKWAKNKQFCQHKIKNFVTTKEAIQGE